MEGRIKMQKVLLTANRLPQPDTYPRFRKEGGQDFDNAVENCKSLLIFLLFSDSYKQLLIAVQCTAGMLCPVTPCTSFVLGQRMQRFAQRRVCADEFQHEAASSGYS